MQSGLENTCLSLYVCPHCLLAFVPECDAPACCVQDRPLRFIILTGNPTAKCSRASSWKQGVKSCDWWVLCFPLLASQRVSSQGENAPDNHHLNIFFTKNLLVCFRARRPLLLDGCYPEYLSATPFIFAVGQISKN